MGNGREEGRRMEVGGRREEERAMRMCMVETSTTMNNSHRSVKT